MLIIKIQFLLYFNIGKFEHKGNIQTFINSLIEISKLVLNIYYTFL